MVVVLAFAKYADGEGGEGSVIYLRDNTVEVGVLPEVGGRIVSLRLPDGNNLLKSDESLWGELPSERPRLSESPVWKEYGGHIVWLAPQSAWWATQEIYPNMRNRNWPPDPHLIYGNYQILKRSRDAIVLQGPVSPVSGVCLTKEIRLLGEGRVLVAAMLENCSAAERSWGIWMNTRFAARTPSYFALSGGAKPPYEFISPDSLSGEAVLPFEVANGFFTFRVDLPVPEGLASWSNKVSALPEGGCLAAFPKGAVFIKQANSSQASKVHPEHRFAEIYNKVPADSSGWGILELEFIGPEVVLEPGQITRFEEVWTVLPYSGPNQRDAHVRCLRALLR